MTTRAGFFWAGGAVCVFAFLAYVGVFTAPRQVVRPEPITLSPPPIVMPSVTPGGPDVVRPGGPGVPGGPGAGAGVPGGQRVVVQQFADRSWMISGLWWSAFGASVVGPALVIVGVVQAED